MRTKLFSLLLISSFVLGSLPVAIAQEIPVEPDVSETVSELPAVDSVETPEPPKEETASSTTPVTEESPAGTPGVSDPPSVGKAENTASDQAFAPESEISSLLLAEEVEAPWTIEAGVDLPNGCTAEDTLGNAHVFPIATSTEYLAVCALVEAVENGDISGFQVTDSSFGLYVTGVNGVGAGAGGFWALWLNGDFASCGVGCLPLGVGDTLELVRTTFDGAESDRLTLHVTSLVDEFDNIVLPNGCDVIALDGSVHSFPTDDSSLSDYLAVCALAAAKDQGYWSGFGLTNASFGLYVTGVNGVAAGAGGFWALWLNGDFASCGVGCLPLGVGDSLGLILTTFDGMESERETLRVIGLEEIAELPEETPGGDPPGRTGAFSVPVAFAFLATGQNSDGSWDSELVTDWSALALAVSGAPSGMKSKLAAYLREEDSGVSSVLDNERHAMALMALGINPYTGGPDDYITPIVESFDGEQIDDSGLVTDDIFALIPLLHAGYTRNDDMIQKIAAFIVDEQEGDGSWVHDVDRTAAAVQALSMVRSAPGVSSALADAESYLRDSQDPDGGFGNVFSTGWALQAIEALGDSPDDWKTGEKTPLTYLADAQKVDGGLDTTPGDYDTRAWATAYAIPAAKGVTWDDVLRDFRKPAGLEEKEGDVLDDETATTTEESLMLPAPVETLAPESPVATTSASVLGTEAPATVSADPMEEAFVPEEKQDSEITEAPENDLIAGAAGSGAWEWLKGLLAEFWSLVKGLFS